MEYAAAKIVTKTRRRDDSREVEKVYGGGEGQGVEAAPG
jgi:hypothetical protein